MEKAAQIEQAWTELQKAQRRLLTGKSKNRQSDESKVAYWSEVIARVEKSAN